MISKNRMHTGADNIKKKINKHFFKCKLENIPNILLPIAILKILKQWDKKNSALFFN